MTLIERIENIEKLSREKHERFEFLANTPEVKEYLSLQYFAFSLEHKTADLKKMVEAVEQEIEKLEVWQQ